MLFNYTLLETRILVFTWEFKNTVLMTTNRDIRNCEISKTLIELLNVWATSMLSENDSVEQLGWFG